jgi:hypothetical protein
MKALTSAAAAMPRALVVWAVCASYYLTESFEMLTARLAPCCSVDALQMRFAIEAADLTSMLCSDHQVMIRTFSPIVSRRRHTRNNERVRRQALERYVDSRLRCKQ